METVKLKKIAQFARRSLLEQVGNKLKPVLAPDSPERRESPQTIAERPMVKCGVQRFKSSGGPVVGWYLDPIFEFYSSDDFSQILVAT